MGHTTSCRSCDSWARSCRKRWVGEAFWLEFSAVENLPASCKRRSMVPVLHSRSVAFKLLSCPSLLTKVLWIHESWVNPFGGYFFLRYTSTIIFIQSNCYRTEAVNLTILQYENNRFLCCCVPYKELYALFSKMVLSNKYVRIFFGQFRKCNLKSFPNISQP